MLLWVQKIVGGQARSEALQATVKKDTLCQVMHKHL
jgi:hypothetical protein